MQGAAQGPITGRPAGGTRQALSRLVNGPTGISADMAVRLSKAFGSSPEAWPGMQMAYDLGQARERTDRISVERLMVADPC